MEEEKEELVVLSEEDVYTSSDMTVEASKEVNPFVLGQLVGPFMAIEEDNGNGRYYLRETINKDIVDSDYVKRMINAKALLGEPHHPDGERNSIWMDESAISTRQVWVDSTGKYLMGRADILDTPKGRIVWTLAKYGTQIGISARANGKGVKQGNHLVIKPENYYFKTFDVVLNPGFQEARPSKFEPNGEAMRVYEEDTSIDKMCEELKDMVSKGSCDKKMLKSYIEYSEDEKLREILPLLEENTESPVSDNTKKSDEESKDVVTEEVSKDSTYESNVRSEIASVRSANAEYLSKISALEEENTKLKGQISSMKNLDSVNEEADSFIGELFEEIKSQKAANVSIQRSLDLSRRTIKGLREEMDSVEDTEDDAKTLTEENVSEVNNSEDKSLKIDKTKDLFGKETMAINEECEPSVEVNLDRVSLIKSVGGVNYGDKTV